MNAPIYPVGLLLVVDVRDQMAGRQVAAQMADHSVNIQGTFKEHSGNIQGTFGEHSV